MTHDAITRTKALCFCALLLAIAVSCSAAGQQSTAIRWLDPLSDKAIYDSVKRAFAPELEPDNPAKVAPYVAELFKYIARIGVHDSSAIVIIGERENEHDHSGDYFIACNYDLKSAKKSKIQNFGGYVWKSIAIARLDSSTVPDIIFDYLSCTECESTLLLGSFRYDPLTKVWGIRKWSPKDESLMVGSDDVVGGDEGTISYDCAFRLGDFLGNGFSQVVVWCRETYVDEHKSHDTTLFYSAIQNPMLISVTGRMKLRQLHTFICKTNSNSKLCSPH